MKLRMILFTLFIAGCSHGGGTAISSSSAGLSVQASGSTAAALIGLGIAGAVIYRSEASGRAPELAPVRRVNEQDCTRPIEDISANLKCR